MKLTRQKASTKGTAAAPDSVPAKSPVRVVVIDDHEMIVQSLVRLLAADSRIEVVGTSLSAKDGIEVARRLRPDVVVIDYQLPDMEAPAAIKRLLDTVPGVKVVTLTGSESPSSYYVSKSAGSAAWVRKTRAIQELRTAIMKVASGQTYLSEEMEPQPPLTQLAVHYQPIVSLDDGSIVGFEALVRWLHPERGLLLPDEFLPGANETGFVAEIDRWVLHEATRQLAVFQGLRPRAPRLFVSVNVSPASVADPRLVAYVAEEVELSTLEMSDVVVELKESFLVENPEVTVAVQAAFTSAGARLAISDVGLSFSETIALPFDCIKIGKSLIRELPGSTGTVWAVDNIINLAQSTSTLCIAEGVEETRQLDALRTVGVKFGQGFLFAAPINGDDSEALLATPHLAPHSEIDTSVRNPTMEVG